jgi:hypothetical protein
MPPDRRTLPSLFIIFIAALTLVAPIWPPTQATAAITPAAATTKAAPAAALADTKPDQAVAAVKETSFPDQYGMSAEYGYTYAPQRNLSFLLARVFAIYDYGTVWHQDRPKALRFKVEAAAGSTLTPDNDFMASVNMLALYYPGMFATKSLRPYFEGGIGVIYTEFRVKGQGLHYNFNPLLGIGCELPQENGKNPFAAIRLHHLSNAEFYNENRGVNSVELQIGRYF